MAMNLVDELRRVISALDEEWIGRLARVDHGHDGGQLDHAAGHAGLHPE